LNQRPLLNDELSDDSNWNDPSDTSGFPIQKPQVQNDTTPGANEDSEDVMDLEDSEEA